MGMNDTPTSDLTRPEYNYWPGDSETRF